jgi:hypothetical protein
MMRMVQLALADTAAAVVLREAISRSGPWHVELVDSPNLALTCVLVLDEASFSRLPLPLAHPERVVLICRQDPQLLAQAWDAGIVSVVSSEAPVPTVLLAIGAAALRNGRSRSQASASVISPKPLLVSAPITPAFHTSRSKRCKSR